MSKDKWQVLSSKELLRTPYFNIVLDNTLDFNGDHHEFYKLEGQGGVMVVPIKVNLEKQLISFIMVEQYRHAVNTKTYEFPAGKREPGEDSRSAAIRELKEETGFAATNIKFLYTSFIDSCRATDQVNIFVATIDDNKDVPILTGVESGSALKTKEVYIDDIHKMVMNNELTNLSTLAAMFVIMMQSKEATKYLDVSIERNSNEKIQ